MRMLALHVNDAFVFGRFDLRQMRVYRCRLTGMRVHMEKRRVQHGDQERWYHAKGCQLSRVL